MMKGASYRMDKYNAKTGATRLGVDITAMLPIMTARVNAVTPMIVDMETRVKQECDAAGIPTHTYAAYLAFGRELFRKVSTQEISGESLAQYAAVEIAKWVARGCVQSVLQGIRGTVFSVGAPVNP